MIRIGLRERCVRVINRQHSVLPGFGISLGLTLMYLGLVVLIPLSALVVKALGMTFEDFWQKAIADPRVMASYRVSLSAALVAGLVNSVFGFILAWVLVRYQFPGKRLLDAIVDLPFALPTAVSGIALVGLYASSGWLGGWLEGLGLKVAFAWPGIVIALTMIGLPFVVRTMQPAIEQLESESEEAAAILGATRGQTFRRVILPILVPPLLTGFALAFARGLGEFGSVYFIAGNLPMKTEIAPLMILIKLEQYDYHGAAAIGLVMLVASFALLLLINLLQAWTRHRSST